MVSYPSTSSLSSIKSSYTQFSNQPRTMSATFRATVPRNTGLSNFSSFTRSNTRVYYSTYSRFYKPYSTNRTFSSSLFLSSRSYRRKWYRSYSYNYYPRGFRSYYFTFSPYYYSSYRYSTFWNTRYMWHRRHHVRRYRHYVIRPIYITKQDMLNNNQIDDTTTTTTAFQLFHPKAMLRQSSMNQIGYHHIEKM